MKLERLEIQALPGIEPGFVVDQIDPGVNFVTGPNGVGKSSLIRALHALIAVPRADDPPALALSALFTAQGRWRVRRTGREQVWELDGQAAESPRLPHRDLLHCYWLSMEDLLLADERDDRLAGELRRALAGGYDLAALRTEAVFRSSERSGMHAARVLRGAETEFRRVEADYQALRRQEAELPGLEVRIEAARVAAGHADQLRHALALLEARRQRRQIEAALTTFPQGLERLRGDEQGRLDKLDERRAALRRELDTQHQRVQTAQQRLEAAGLEGGGQPDPVVLETARSELEALRRLRERCHEAQRRSEQACAAEQRARIDLGIDGATVSTAEPDLAPQRVAEAESLARRLKELESRHDELSGRLAKAPSVPWPGELEAYWQAAHALRVWLAADGYDARLLFAVLAVALAGAATAGVTAYLAGDWLALAAAGLAATGVALAFWLAPGDDRRAARRRYEECDLSGPAQWRADAVRSRLQQIEADRAALQRRQVDAERAKEQQLELQRVEQALAKLETRRRALAERSGFDPLLTATALDRFVRLADALDSARRERDEHDQAVMRFEQQMATTQQRVARSLAPWRAQSLGGEPQGPALAELEAAWADLGERSRNAEEAQRERSDAEGQARRLTAALAELDEEEAEIFRAAGLSAGERRALAARCEHYPAWREQRERLREARVVEAERRTAIADDTALLAKVEADAGDLLAGELDRVVAEAAELEALREQAGAIRTRLHDAGRDGRLEQSMAAVETARTALEDRYQEALFAQTSQSLLDEVEREYRSEHEPQVLREARERFLYFSHHTYELEVDDHYGFLAWDRTQQVRRGLDELSSGTRMQLLLAVRLAWAGHLEQGRESLPLFLDEALTTSDEERFARVAERLVQWAHDEGRQLFYLTARRHELGLWERATGERPHLIDLARIRFGAAQAELDDYTVPDAEPVPPPAGFSAAAYGVAVEATPVEPRRPIGGLHLFHLLRDDLELLYQLLEHWCVTSLGQLEGLLGSSAAPQAVPSAERRQQLVGRCAVARVWVAAWRYGRGEPVDRTVLERSAAISDTFLERVAALAAAHAGDGQALIAALRAGAVKRFQSSKIDELAQWLEEAGYIDPAEPLERAERERRTLIDAAQTATPQEIRKVVGWLEASCRRCVE